MKILKHILFLSLFLGSIASSYAQLDSKKENSKKGKSKAILAVPAKELKKPTSLDNKNKNGFKGAYNQHQKDLAKKQKQKDLENKGILSNAKIAEERYLSSWKKLNATFPVVDQDLGSFRTNSDKIRIICRDFQYPDGDRVTILINDIPVIKNITLRRAYQGFDLPLMKGLNKIAFVALNQGTSGPNTAAFKVYDDKGNVLASNQWNLATGAKATLLIAKED